MEEEQKRTEEELAKEAKATGVTKTKAANAARAAANATTVTIEAMAKVCTTTNTNPPSPVGGTFEGRSNQESKVEETSTNGKEKRQGGNDPVNMEIETNEHRENNYGPADTTVTTEKPAEYNNYTGTSPLTFSINDHINDINAGGEKTATDTDINVEVGKQHTEGEPSEPLEECVHSRRILVCQ